MSVIQSSIPDAETLHDVLPESKYEHSTAFERRRINTISALEAGLVASSGNVARGAPFNFILNRSTNSLLSLQESYFSVTGTLKITQNDNDGVANHYTRDMLKCSQQWLLSLFQTVTLKLGSEDVERRQIPILYNDYNYIMKSHLRDVEAGCMNQNGLFSNPNSIAIPGASLNKLDWIPFGGNDFDYNISDFDYLSVTANYATTAPVLYVPFTCYLPLSSMFSIDEYKPIFNTDVQITLLRDPTYDVSMVLAPKIDIQLDSIQKFQCDFIQYNMNENFAKLVQKVYQKPQMVVVGWTNGILQTLQNQQPNSQVQLRTPISLLFDLKDLHVAFPKTTVNTVRSTYKLININPGASGIARYNSKWANTAPHCYMPIPLAKINVQTDTYDLIDRNFQNEDIKVYTSATRDQNIITPIAYTGNGTATYTSNYYTMLYHNMLICRRYHGVLEDGIRPSQFYRDKFIISMPCYQFSRITSGGLITLNLNFPNYTINPFTPPATITALDTPMDTYNINQCLIIQHASRALEFNPNTGIHVKDISQSFSNDIALE